MSTFSALTLLVAHLACKQEGQHALTGQRPANFTRASVFL